MMKSLTVQYVLITNDYIWCLFTT